MDKHYRVDCVSNEQVKTACLILIKLFRNSIKTNKEKKREYYTD